MRHKQNYTIGQLLEKATPSKSLYATNSAASQGYEEMGVGGREREDRYRERLDKYSLEVRVADSSSARRKTPHISVPELTTPPTPQRAAKKEAEDIANRHKLILKKKALADSKFTTSSSNDNRLSTLWNDPMKVVESLRERCRQKPHLLGMNFPTSSTSTMGLLSEADISRGLKMMGFDLPDKKLHLVLTVLGLHRSLEGGRSIPLSQVRRYPSPILTKPPLHNNNSNSLAPRS